MGGVLVVLLSMGLLVPCANAFSLFSSNEIVPIFFTLGPAHLSLIGWWLAILMVVVTVLVKAFLFYCVGGGVDGFGVVGCGGGKKCALSAPL